MSADLRRLRSIAKLKPSALVMTETQLASGQIKVTLGKPSSRTNVPSLVLDSVVRGGSDALMVAIQPLLAATIAGQESTILMQGGSGSGKTFTLEGGLPSPSAQRDPGLIDRVINHLWAASGSAIRLHLVETCKAGERICLDRSDTFASPSATIAAYKRAALGVSKAKRRAPRQITEDGLSTRSWTHLTIETGLGGKVHVFEYGCSDDTASINMRYEQLQSGLRQLCGGLMPKSSMSKGPAARIDATLEQIAKSVQVAVIGCIDLTDRVRARTTLELLSALAVAGLPPATPLTDAFHTQAGTRGLTVGAPDPTQDARYQTPIHQVNRGPHDHVGATSLNLELRRRITIDCQDDEIRGGLELDQIGQALHAKCSEEVKRLRIDIHRSAPLTSSGEAAMATKLVRDLSLVNRLGLFRSRVRVFIRTAFLGQYGRRMPELEAALLQSYVDTAEFEIAASMHQVWSAGRTPRGLLSQGTWESSYAENGSDSDDFEEQIGSPLATRFGSASLSMVNESSLSELPFYHADGSYDEESADQDDTFCA